MCPEVGKTIGLIDAAIQEAETNRDEVTKEFNLLVNEIENQLQQASKLSAYKNRKNQKKKAKKKEERALVKKAQEFDVEEEYKTLSDRQKTQIRNWSREACHRVGLWIKQLAVKDIVMTSQPSVNDSTDNIARIPFSQLTGQSGTSSKVLSLKGTDTSFTPRLR